MLSHGEKRFIGTITNTFVTQYRGEIDSRLWLHLILPQIPNEIMAGNRGEVSEVIMEEIIDMTGGDDGEDPQEGDFEELIEDRREQDSLDIRRGE